MDYRQIVKSSFRNDEATMWNSVDRVNEFLNELKKKDPGMVRQFLKQEYEALNGRHLNEQVAHDLVSDMHHTDLNGNVVRGEAVGPEESMMLLDGMDEECKKQLRWDAYAAANAFMHDLGNTGMDIKIILEAARLFWFHDEDFPEKNKVYWYFGLMLF